MLRRAFWLLLVLWAGSLWSLALWVAPTLFLAQGDRHVAGVLAARLFGIESYLGIGTALICLLHPARRRFLLGYTAAGLLALNEWLLKTVMQRALAAGSAAGLSFGAWHGVSALTYLAACLCVLWLIWNEDFR